MNLLKRISNSVNLSAIFLITLLLIIGFFFDIYDAYMNFNLRKRSKATSAKVEYFYKGRNGLFGIYVRYKYKINGKEYSTSENVKNTHYTTPCIYDKEGYYSPSCKGDTIEIIYDSLRPSTSKILGFSKEYNEQEIPFLERMLSKFF